MEKLELKLELLTKDSWSAADIKLYEDCSLSKAYEFKNAVSKIYGSIRFNSGKVSVENYFKFKGVDRKREIEIVKSALFNPNTNFKKEKEIENEI